MVSKRKDSLGSHVLYITDLQGIMKTFWLTPFVDRAFSAHADARDDDEEDVLAVDFAGELAEDLLKRERQCEWVTELIRDSVRDIVAQRATRKGKISKSNDSLPNHRAKNRVPLDEVVDVITIPTFDAKNSEAEAYDVKIPENVSRLLREYVSIVSLWWQCSLKATQTTKSHTPCVSCCRLPRRIATTRSTISSTPVM